MRLRSHQTSHQHDCPTGHLFSALGKKTRGKLFKDNRTKDRQHSYQRDFVETSSLPELPFPLQFGKHFQVCEAESCWNESWIIREAGEKPERFRVPGEQRPRPVATRRPRFGPSYS